MNKLLEALRYPGPMTPQIQGPSDYQRNQQLIEIARRAAHGSTTYLHMLTRMSKANKEIAWKFSKAETQAKLKAIHQAPGI